MFKFIEKVNVEGVISEKITQDTSKIKEQLYDDIRKALKKADDALGELVNKPKAKNSLLECGCSYCKAVENFINDDYTERDIQIAVSNPSGITDRLDDLISKNKLSQREASELLFKILIRVKERMFNS